MKVKTQDLIGTTLDWAVASYADKHVTRKDIHWGNYSPSTNWAQGGPIIEREKIDLFTEKGTPESWVASIARYQNGERLVGWRIHKYGPTPLIAAMRCYVASKLGDEIDIPEGLSMIPSLQNPQSN